MQRKLNINEWIEQNRRTEQMMAKQKRRKLNKAQRIKIFFFTIIICVSVFPSLSLCLFSSLSLSITPSLSLSVSFSLSFPPSLSLFISFSFSLSLSLSPFLPHSPFFSHSAFLSHSPFLSHSAFLSLSVSLSLCLCLSRLYFHFAVWVFPCWQLVWGDIPTSPTEGLLLASSTLWWMLPLSFQVMQYHECSSKAVSVLLCHYMIWYLTSYYLRGLHLFSMHVFLLLTSPFLHPRICCGFP